MRGQQFSHKKTLDRNAKTVYSTFTNALTKRVTALKASESGRTGLRAESARGKKYGEVHFRAARLTM